MKIDYSSPLLLKVRQVGQRIGVLRPAVRLLRRLAGSQYEEAFDRALMASIRPGDTVWDVGANVGLYSVRFADRVGPSGHVVAFEPSPRTFDKLVEQVAGRSQVVARNVGLSDVNDTLTFYTGDELSPTDSLFRAGAGEAARSVEVVVRRGDDEASGAVPDVIKIDVEGFEAEVVRGLESLLRNPRLRGVFVEIHFQVLNERGLPNASKEICDRLAAAGLTIAWPDPSHIAATR